MHKVLENLEAFETTRYGVLPKILKFIFLILSAIGIGSVVFYVFGFSIGGTSMSDTAYYYFLFTCFLAPVFLLLPARKKDKTVLPWYDIVLAALLFGMSLYFFLNAYEIRTIGWIPAKPFNLVLASIFLLLVWDGARRMGGNIYAAVCVIIGLYALYAEHMPGPLYGMSFPLNMTISLQVFGTEGILGLPSKVMGDILIGFLIFAGVLIASGAGTFFLNFALALLGRFRGGPGKVSVLSSALFGTLSGSVVSNVVADGYVTIPTMIRVGFDPRVAGAIEACTSTGGVLMPPVMGTVAFVMAMVLGIDYWAVCVAAAVPAVLYYFALLMQIDAYAARVGLKGLPPAELPSLKETLKWGWPFLAVLAFLLWALMIKKMEAQAPFYASVLMILLSFFRKETRMTPRGIVNILSMTGRIIVETMAILVPVGTIVCGLVQTGVASAATAGLIALGGQSVYLIILLGTVACYLMGMAGMVTPAYIFLAVTMAPALVEMGLNRIAVHLFILYYSMLAAITPPVAIGAFVAANIAGADPMQTALQSMRFGVVIYIVPLFFLFNPALCLQGGSLFEMFYLFVLAMLGITLIAAGMEGYLIKVGKVGLAMRFLLVIAGMLIAFPELISSLIGAVFACLAIVVIWRTNKKARKSSGAIGI